MNAIDVNSDELVHSWIVKIETEVPEITQTIELVKSNMKNEQI